MITRGRPGHFICSHDCAFFICQDTPQFRVSTVGDYHPNTRPRDRCDETRDGLGGKARVDDPDMYYETLVFALDEDGEHNGIEIDGKRYRTEEEAHRGHVDYVRRYLR